jgi:hypothetical protein
VKQLLRTCKVMSTMYVLDMDMTRLYGRGVYGRSNFVTGCFEVHATGGIQRHTVSYLWLLVVGGRTAAPMNGVPGACRMFQMF